MTFAKHYANLAESFRAKALKQKDPTLRAEWEELADCYARLAEQSRSFDEAEHLNFIGEMLS